MAALATDPVRPFYSYAYFFIVIVTLQAANDWPIDAKQWCLRIVGSAVPTLLLEGIIRAYWGRKCRGKTFST